MVARAYILVSAVPGMEKQVMDEVSVIKGVSSADLVYGSFDLVVKIESEGPSDILLQTVRKIRNVMGVRATLTMSTMGGRK